MRSLTFTQRVAAIEGREGPRQGDGTLAVLRQRVTFFLILRDKNLNDINTRTPCICLFLRCVSENLDGVFLIGAASVLTCPDRFHLHPVCVCVFVSVSCVGVFLRLVPVHAGFHVRETAAASGQVQSGLLYLVLLHCHGLYL